MARYPLTVKGTSHIIDTMVDNTLEALKKFNRNSEPGDELEVGGPVKIRGQYAVDNQGNLGFFANVVGTGGVVGGSAGINDDSDIEWNRDANGTMELEFMVKIKAARF